MAEAKRERRIVRDLMSEPHIEGRRIGVRQIRDCVEGGGLRPETVADRYDLDRADVYRALAYYHEHPREMERIDEEREQAYEALLEGIERPSHVDPEGSTDNTVGSKSSSRSDHER
jgi:uncharacterized protein (DUF433 family)